MSILRTEDQVFEGMNALNQAQTVIASDDNEDGVLALPSDLNGNVTLSIFAPGNSTAVYTASLAPAQVLFVARPWDKDTIGYNFEHEVTQADVGAGVLRGGRRYTMVYSLPTKNDGAIKHVFIWNVEPLHA